MKKTTQNKCIHAILKPDSPRLKYSKKTEC